MSHLFTRFNSLLLVLFCGLMLQLKAFRWKNIRSSSGQIIASCYDHSQRSCRKYHTSPIMSTSVTDTYSYTEIEKKWQEHWETKKIFAATRRAGYPKKYVLDMFPYPSGSGLHVGHPEGYTATDIMSRYWRNKGFDVLHPMGWDAFGLPAEQHAINTGTHPAVTTGKNIAVFKRQLKSLGFSYDW